uniref:MD-2-related lipid-recognition domain-containing protein n=1 Tax=Parascaris equorum TaxID=6256 RepID=A0A914RV83_PAREQ
MINSIYASFITKKQKFNIYLESNFELLTVEASGCPGKANHCPFKRGSEPRIRIGFKPKTPSKISPSCKDKNKELDSFFCVSTRDVRELETSVRAKLGAVFVPFNLEEKNACVGGNLTCPLKAGQTYYYSQSVKILHQYPKVGVLLCYRLIERQTSMNARHMLNEFN